MLGQCCGIAPDKGKVCSPADGEIIRVVETNSDDFSAVKRYKAVCLSQSKMIGCPGHCGAAALQ